MQIKASIRDNVAILTLSGNFLCEPDTLKLREKLYSLLADETRNVVIDLNEVDCINSQGLGTLISALTTLRKAGGNLRLARAGETVQNLLNITRLVKVFEIYDSVEEALVSYSERGVTKE